MDLEEFDFDYDKENDSLFIFKPNVSSKSSIELGNFVYDYDGKGQIVGIEILSAKETISDTLNHDVSSKFLENIKDIKVSFKPVKNLMMIKIFISFNPKILKDEIISSVQVPNLRNQSPASC
ncbi:MAG: DUF2283 domain-containing protein [Candidatus Nanoarchaeia archaeon]|nr:DUF2283 domain-containing protein [Candidatus Nanoarchaeia archaeon]